MSRVRTNERISMDLIEDIQSLGSTISHDTSACQDILVEQVLECTRFHWIPLKYLRIYVTTTLKLTMRLRVWKPTMILGREVNQSVGLRSSCEQEAGRAPQYSTGCRLQAMGSNRYRF
jgi:hypothetical protein